MKLTLTRNLKNFQNSLKSFQNNFTRSTSMGYERLDKLLFSEEGRQSDYESDDKGIENKQNRARAIKVIKHFTDTPHLNELKEYIPSEHFVPKRRLSLQHLYLCDKQIAQNVASRILPYLQKNKKQIVCETNAGLGLISAELLDNGVKSLRLYESCNEFRQLLKDFGTSYPNRVELFYKDFFHLSLHSAIDRYDHGDRVSELLRGVPSRSWDDDPAITIIGSMANLSFIKYLIKMLAFQQEIITYGRTQIFALMNPRDYIRLTATCHMNLHTYQIVSVLFQLFFESKLLEKYPRTSFLPWETKAKLSAHTRQHTKIDLDYIYLVQINFKKVLPLQIQHLMQFYYFVNHGFIKGRSRVIPTMEKWMPGIGMHLIVPKEKHKRKCFPNMSIFTEFGELTPIQILNTFMEMAEHPEYKDSPFLALVESQLQKTETIDTDLAETSTVSSNVANLQTHVK